MKKLQVTITGVLFLFLLICVPVRAASQEEVPSVQPCVYENPGYEGLPEEEAQTEAGDANLLLGAGAEIPYYSSVQSASAYLQKKMVARDSNISFKVYGSSSSWETVFKKVIAYATIAEDDTAPNLGDYLFWHYRKFQGSYTVVAKGSGYCYTFVGQMVYMSTASQEAEVTTKLKTVMRSLHLEQMTSEYQMVQAIYEYITSHVTYDYNTLNDSTLGKYSAYKALCQGTAVCQGYANLMYRMLREAGLSTRFIGGYSHGEGHAWNIVRIGNQYYNLDSTWDAGRTKSTYQYFLKGQYQFPDHVRDAQYTTSAFSSKYPVASASYVYEENEVKKAAYSLTYVLNGGTNNPKNPASYFHQTVYLADPARKGYKFIGWYTDSGLTKSITKISQTSAKSYTLYAKWSKIVVPAGRIKSYVSDGTGLRIHFQAVSGAKGYRISYSKNASFTASETGVCYVEASKTSKAIRVKQPGTRYYVRVQAYEIDSAGAKVFGSYSGKVCGTHVSYVLNGGTNALSNPYYVYQKSLLLASPVRVGYTFSGWYSDRGYKNKAVMILSSESRAKTFYARWKKSSL